MKNDTIPILQVAAKAVIVDNNGRVLLVRESNKDENNTQVGFWGAPGGRLEPGEAFNDALKREVLDEVGIEIEAIKPIFVGEWNPIIKGVPHQIVAIFMLCKPKTFNIVLSNEHDDYEWVGPADRKNYPMMPPDDQVVDLVPNL